MPSNTQTSPRSWLRDLPQWTILAPVFAAIVMTAAALGLPLVGFFVAVIALSLAGSVFAAVHHAEVNSC